jgi:3-phosphoshikimate 1-carboxyvinyltransferase
MQYTVHKPDTLNSTSIQLPASKSISNRVLLLQTLSHGNIDDIQNLSDSDDTHVLLQALTNPQPIIDLQAAGTSMRFLTACLAAQPGKHILTGTNRMKNRPIAPLVNALRQIGAEIEYLEKEGFPPLLIKGKQLAGGKITLDASVSSQYISALMMIAPITQHGLEIKIEGHAVSKPYIRMTQLLMQTFGIQIPHTGNIISIPPQHSSCRLQPFVVENDWSAASYWYEILAIAPQKAEIHLKGLRKNSLQGDAKVAQLFEAMGVTTTFVDDGIVLQPTDRTVSPFIYNFRDEPDLAQTFAVTCALKNIPFHFTGLQTLKIKETDRIIALHNEMKKLGYEIKIIADSEISWDGTHTQPATIPPIDTYNDHRMAMAFAPAALRFGSVDICDPEVVGKSYPAFWADLRKAGFQIVSQ